MSVPTLSPQDFQKEPSCYHILDVRAPWEVALASLPFDFMNIPLDVLGEHVEELSSDRPWVTVCHHGVRSVQAAALLQSRGLKAYSLEGGIDRYSKMCDPTVSLY